MSHCPLLNMRVANMAKIQILEKLNEKRLLLSWCEPDRCNYTEQLWSLRKMTRKATCALTGRSISRGEQAFAPLGSPANLGNFIAVNAVPAVGAGAVI